MDERKLFDIIREGNKIVTRCLERTEVRSGDWYSADEGGCDGHETKENRSNMHSEDEEEFRRVKLISAEGESENVDK